MANKASKGRQKQPVNKGKGLISTGGPRKSFARKEIAKTSVATKSETSKVNFEAPITVCVIPFHGSIFNQELVGLISHMVVVESEISSLSGVEIKSGHIPGHPKKRIQLVIPNHRENLEAILDSAKAADALLCLFPTDATYDNSCFDELGYKTLTALRMQGLPPLVVGSVVNTSEKKIGMKTVHRYFFSELSQDKAKFIMPSANVKPGDYAAIASQIMSGIISSFSGTLSSKVSESLALRRMRGYMLIEKFEVSGNGKVEISGYARGAGFSTSCAVHLTGYPHTFRVARLEVTNSSNGMEEVSVIEPPTEAVDLSPLRPAEIQEQTWPTEEEEAEAEKALLHRRMMRVMVPAGANSELEAAWLGEEIIGEDSLELMMDQQEEEDGDSDEKLIEGMFDWDKEADFVSSKKVPEFEQRDRQDMDFVDEVDTPQTMTARERFQKYRGLKSLRNGNWDPYEELPAEFSQIHEFQDISFMTKQSFNTISEGGKDAVNRYCKIVLEPVVAEGESVLPVEPGTVPPLVASTMAPLESKVTIVHCRLNRLPEAVDLDIKTKDTVTVQIGFRRFEVKPIFSEIPKYSSSTGTCPIQRMYRYLPSDTSASIMMSFYAPAIFGSSPALVFHSGRLALWGSVGGCAPNRPIVVKRATLTGYPFRVHQTKAVCRFMFFNPEDIDWFKPVELTTKKGLRGHIIESLGTHGYMKCRFNGQLTSDDVICLHLYKRAYPKFHTVAWGQQM